MAKLKFVVAAGFAVLSVGMQSPLGAPAAPREVNVTADSARGWLPSGAESARVEKAARDYWAARDGGRTEQGYRFLTDILKSRLAYGNYAMGILTFNTKAGPVIERRIVKVTWTKNPAQAPAPGIYAAIDVVGRFANADRFCGFLILYQPPAGGDYRVMREEDNYLDNAEAQSMAHSGGDVNKMWAELSSHCPNYPGAHR